MTRRSARTVVQRAGVSLVAERHGPPDAPGVLLTHGVASSIQFLAEALAPPLLAAGHRVELMGLAGHDPSSAAPQVARHDLDEVAGDLGAMALETRCGIVGGVSLGAHAAVRLAALNRTGDWQHDGSTIELRALVVCLPAWVGRAQAGEGVHAQIATDVRTLGVPALIDRLQGDETMADWLRDTLPRDWARHDPDSVAAALLSLDGGDAPTAEELASLEVPVVIVTWPDDPGHPIAAAQQWHELLPTSVLRRTTIDEMQRDRTLFGQLAFDGLAELGVT